MTTLSKSVKVKNAVSATYLLLFYNTKKQVTLQFTVHWVQCRMWRFSFRNTSLHRDILVLFCFLAVRSLHSENNRSTMLCLSGRRHHEIQFQLRQSLVAGLAIQPELYGTLCLKWSSVLELCRVTLQFRFSIGSVSTSAVRNCQRNAICGALSCVDK